jgi:hypothetical protein
MRKIWKRNVLILDAVHTQAHKAVAQQAQAQSAEAQPTLAQVA